MTAKASPPLKLSEREHRILSGYIRKRDTGNHQIKRIKIVLKGSEGQSTYSISKEIGLGYDPVASWRKRWRISYADLKEYGKGDSGKGVSDAQLLKRMLSILQDLPRPGAPPKFTLSQKQQIVALACCKPSEYGVEMINWTHEMLAHVAQAQKVVESISPRHVGEILKKSGLTSA